MKKKGVLLVNLGSPDSPKTADVRRYLREFLMDGRVLDAPYPIRFAVVNFAILPTRPKASAEAYHKVWLPEGSPLIATSKVVHGLVRERVKVPVELAMRYQNPSIENGLKNLLAQGVGEILLITMFPHYAMSSHETAVVRVQEVLRKLDPTAVLQVVSPYYNDPDYIAALALSAEPYLQKGYDHLLFSYHGLPERHLRKADTTGSHCLKVPNCCEVASPAHGTCYRAQCYATTRALVKRAGIPDGKWSVAFQSRLGRDPWLQPYTDKELPRLAAAGVKKMLVICPAFVTDCLETLEEIGMRAKEDFIAAGGEDLQLIPCLNTHPRWIAFLERLIGEFTGRAA